MEGGEIFVGGDGGIFEEVVKGEETLGDEGMFEEVVKGWEPFGEVGRGLL